jgi:hypothetical protein
MVQIETELLLYKTIIDNMAEGVSLVKVGDSRIVYTTPSLTACLAIKAGN